MSRISMLFVLLLLLVWTNSLAIPHPGHSQWKQPVSPVDNQQARTDAEDQAEVELFAVNDLPTLLARLNQKKSPAAAEQMPEMAKPYREETR